MNHDKAINNFCSINFLGWQNDLSFSQVSSVSNHNSRIAHLIIFMFYLLCYVMFYHMLANTHTNLYSRMDFQFANFGL